MIRPLATILGWMLVLGLMSGAPVAAQTKTLEEQKTEWQDQYRSLLRDAARLAYNAEVSRENYARAQRRNYPRGGARDQFLLDADTSEKKLVKVKAEIEAFLVQARHDAVPPAWRYSVEDEDIDRTPPASAREDDDPQDRDGRNPLYLDDDGKDDKKKRNRRP